MTVRGPGYMDGGLITAVDMNTMVMNCTPQLVAEPEKVKHYCAWCHGITFDDSHGHCCACGGMRGKPLILQAEDIGYWGTDLETPRKEVQPLIPQVTLCGKFMR